VSDQRGGEADEVLVRLNDQRELPARIVGRDPKTDIAVLKIEAASLPHASLADSDKIEVGDVVFAIGNPMGVGLTVTQGIVSATGRAIGIYGEEGYEDFIQTDASINPGNSGGALVDTDGRVIGINSAILSGSGGNIGLGFAIPSQLAVSVTKQLTEFGEVRRGYIGIQISALTPDMAEAFGLQEVQGVVIDEVVEGLPAQKAGLKRGDVVVKLGERPIRNPNDLRTRIAQQPPGTKLVVSLMRDKKALELEVEVGDQDLTAGASGGELLDGIDVQPLTAELRKQLNLREAVEGLAVTAADPRSAYSRYLPAGTVLLEINDRPVTSVDSAREALRPGVNKLYVFAEGRTGYLALRLR
jgi:serine protease Do/serine protease DegQ